MKDLGYLSQYISIIDRQYYKETQSQCGSLGLTPTSASILLSINDHLEINKNQISKLLVLDRGLVTKQVNKLIELRYVKTTPGTGRSQKLSLTDKGVNIIPQVRKIRNDWWKKELSCLDDNQQEILITSIEKMVQRAIKNSDM